MKSLELVRGLFAVLLLLPCFAVTEPVDVDAAGGRVIYDQRQSGKYNIHVSIKDVAIIEMDQNEIEDETYNEGDYYYDEGDLTVKPLPLGIIQKLTTTTAKAASTTSTLSASALQTITSTTGFTDSTDANSLSTDIPTTQTADGSTVSLNITVPTTIPSSIAAKRSPNVIILETSTASHSSPTSTHRPIISTTEILGRSKDIPMQSVLEQLLLPRLHYNNYKTATTPTSQQQPPVQLQAELENEYGSRSPDDSKIYKFKVRRAHKQGPQPPSPAQYHARTRCRPNQYRDSSGNCRIKRSSSLL